MQRPIAPRILIPIPQRWVIFGIRFSKNIEKSEKRMTDKKIEQIANFMYSADNNQEVPFRISLMFGMGGFDVKSEIAR